LAWAHYSYKVIAPIDASSLGTLTMGAGSNINNIFTGNFDEGIAPDGHGYAITNLSINTGSSYSYPTGFIGNSFGGIISNVNLSTGCSISGTGPVGSIVGDLYSGSMTNCISSASVTGIGTSSFDIGGLIGYIYAATIDNCTFSGSVSGGSNIGGIAGGMGGFGSIVQGSTLTDVSGNGSIGKTGTVTCNGSVTGQKYVGGIVGALYHGTVNTANIVNSSNTSKNIGGSTQ